MIFRWNTVSYLGQTDTVQRNTDLDGGFKYFLFSSLFGEDSHFDYYFSKGLKPPTRDICF